LEKNTYSPTKTTFSQLTLLTRVDTFKTNYHYLIFFFISLIYSSSNIIQSKTCIKIIKRKLLKKLNSENSKKKIQKEKYEK